ncbi:MAG: CDP-alcohol phosphatidyltransferase family protein [Candidatus Marinimicrobia bacterium]|nr:CDP-alcohol phosphatidyltransferase family protein [Candidatus Neomarinimicrobiota bacterium]
MNRDVLKLPNLLTIFRMIMSVVLYGLFMRHFRYDLSTGSLFLFILYLVIALTDLVDGIIARKFDMITELGKELDPLADKVLVFLMLFAFYRIGLFPLWIIVPVFLRDLFVNWLRKRSRSLGIGFKTSNLAKAKTAVQMIFIGFVMALPAAQSLPVPPELYRLLADLSSGNAIPIMMTVIMIFTVYTGVDYYLKYQKEANRSNK